MQAIVLADTLILVRCLLLSATFPLIFLSRGRLPRVINVCCFQQLTLACHFYLLFLRVIYVDLFQQLILACYFCLCFVRVIDVSYF